MKKVTSNSTLSSMISGTLFDGIFLADKRGKLELIPDGERKLLKRINEIAEKNKSMNTPSLAEGVVDPSCPLTEQLEQAILPPLVYQFGGPQEDNVYRVWGKETSSGHVVMSMTINGKVLILKNEEGSESTPALAGFITGKGLVYGTEASKILLPPKRYGLPVLPPKVWQCLNLKPPISINQQQFQSVDLKEFGLFNLSGLFFNAYLIRKLKITAESQYNNGGLCQVAIMAVPMLTKSAQRLRLKEAAVLAGFKDVYLATAEGLAAYYWFHEKETEMEQNNYSKEFVIIDLFGHAVAYKKSFESGVDRKKILVVKAILLLDNLRYSQTVMVHFGKMLRMKLNIPQNDSLIPVIRTEGDLSRALFFGSSFTTFKVVNDAEANYFAAKGAALLSKTPGNLGHHIQNMFGTTIEIEGDVVTQREQLLPENFVRLSFSMKHVVTNYQIIQTRRQESETIGNLIISGVQHGTELEVTYELNWEGIWKVVGVSAKSPSEDDGAVKWDWVIGDKVGFASFGASSYEECASLLLKILPSTGQGNVTSARLTKDDSSGGLLNSQVDETVVASVCSSSATSSGNRNEIEKRKRSTKSKVIRPNDMIVNGGLKKIKLESDWVDSVVVKTEQDSMEDFEEGGNGQQINFKEHEVGQVEEGVVKVEMEDQKSEISRKMMVKKKVLRNRKQQ